MPSSRSRLGPAWVGLVALVALVVGAPPANAAWESDYGSRTGVTFGANVHASLPVSLDLPAPASGGAVTSVSVTWSEPIPQQDPQAGLSSTARLSLDTAACTADSRCQLETVLPTGRMANGSTSITFLVSNSEGLVNFFSRLVTIENPKPWVTLTPPADNRALWGEATIHAEAGPGAPNGAPLAGVRFYIGGTLNVGSRYLFDATAPYSVTMPATDIAPVLGSGRVVAVAQDTDGTLSSPAWAAQRRVTVGPPPDITWPTGPNTTRGSLSAGVWPEFHAELPDSAPAGRGAPYDPFISEFETFLDGRSLGVSSYTDPSSWNGQRAGAMLRSVTGWTHLTQANGLTAGKHVVKARVTTSYGAVAESSTTVIAADGLSWTGPVTSGGRVVEDGFVVTAGTLNSFAVPVATKVPDTYLLWSQVEVGDLDVQVHTPLCWTDDLPACPESAVVRGNDWFAPERPGTRVLRITALAEGDDAPRTLTRTLVIQPAAELSLVVPRRVTRPGGSVTVTGRLVRRDNDAPQARRRVAVLWRSNPGAPWQRVATSTTDRAGFVNLRVRPPRGGVLRLRSAEVRGVLGPGVSRVQRVYVRR